MCFHVGLADFLVGVDHHRSSSPILYTIDRDNRREEVRLQIPDAAMINVYDFAVSTAGEVAAIGSSYAAHGKPSTYVARISSGGKQQIIIRTWPYAPLAVTFAPDGSLWTIGRLKDDSNTRLIAEPVLRRFDPTGKVLELLFELKVKGSNVVETSSMAASRDRVACSLAPASILNSH